MNFLRKWLRKKLRAFSNMMLYALLLLGWRETAAATPAAEIRRTECFTSHTAKAPPRSFLGRVSGDKIWEEHGRLG
jgi:hypothetical protein